jgi:hypothetical protein
MDNLSELPRGVIRIPVAGPKPNNTLVFVRGFIPQPDFTYDTELVRAWLSFDTLFRIDGFLQSKVDEYLANTQISITAYIENLACVNDDTFVCAVDEVEGYITADGALKGRALIAEMDTEELTMGFYFSAWVLTYEPRPAEFPVIHERKWSLEQAARIHDRVSHGGPSDHDRVTIVGAGRHAEADRMRLERYFADRALRRAQGVSPAAGNPRRRRGSNRVTKAAE